MPTPPTAPRAHRDAAAAAAAMQFETDVIEKQTEGGNIQTLFLVLVGVLFFSRKHKKYRSRFADVERVNIF